MSTANTPLLKQAFWWPKASTISRTLTGTDSGTAWTNTNATAAITFTLPKAAVGLTAVVSGLAFQFLVASAHNVSIQPKTGDTIRGLAASTGLVLTTVGQMVELECVTAGFWEVMAGNTFPDGITVTGTATVGGNTIATTTNGTFTATLTGVTATVTVTARYNTIGNVCFLYIPALNGTTNSTSCTITGLPTAINSGRDAQQIISVNNAGTTTTGVFEINGNAITLYPSLTGAANSWANAAQTKGINTCLITYPLN